MSVCMWVGVGGSASEHEAGKIFGEMHFNFLFALSA